MDIKKYFKEVREYINNLSDEEFEDLLIESGFEIEKGDGKIIFTEEPCKSCLEQECISWEDGKCVIRHE